MTNVYVHTRAGLKLDDYRAEDAESVEAMAVLSLNNEHRVSAKEIKDAACAEMGLDPARFCLVVAGEVRPDSYTFSLQGINRLLLDEVPA